MFSEIRDISSFIPSKLSGAGVGLERGVCLRVTCFSRSRCRTVGIFEIATRRGKRERGGEISWFGIEGLGLDLEGENSRFNVPKILLFGGFEGWDVWVLGCEIEAGLGVGGFLAGIGIVSGSAFLLGYVDVG